MPSGVRESDRRLKARFDIVGHLRGTFAFVETLTVRNLSRGGALVETLRPLPPHSMHTLQFQREITIEAIQARVVRVTPSAAKRGYILALEFINAAPTALAQIDRILHAKDSDLA